MVDTFKDLNKKLNKCKTLSRDIIKKALVYINYIENDDREFLEDFLEKETYGYFSEDYIVKRFERASYDIVEDAEKVLKEIDGFIKIIISNEDILDYENKYPFMVRIWTGDTYGKGGAEGISMLIKDLEDTIKHLESDEDFFNFVRKKYLY